MPASFFSERQQDALHRVAAVERRVRVLEDDLERAQVLASSASGSVAASCRAVERSTAPVVGGTIPSSARASVVLPLPDSPTSPSVSPGQIAARDADERVDVVPLLLEDLAEVVELQQRLGRCGRSPGARDPRPPRAAASAPARGSGSGSCGPAPMLVRSAGSSVRQRSSASAQRSAKTQPGSSAPTLGRKPGIVSSRPVILAHAAARNAAQEADGVRVPRVLRAPCSAGALLDERAGVEHADAVAHLRRSRRGCG